jgi:hypothetical protein
LKLQQQVSLLMRVVRGLAVEMVDSYRLIVLVMQLLLKLGMTQLHLMLRLYYK